MVHGSTLSLISSSPASVCSLTSNYSNCPPPGNSDWPSSFLSSRVLSFLKRKNSGLSKFKLKASSQQQQQQQLEADDGPAKHILQDNSIAGFLRFIKTGSNSNSNDSCGEGGGGPGSSALQTAVVSYRKKFPWSLLQPFLQIDLVSTVHIADKEYFEILQKELEQYDCVLYEMIASRESLESIRSPPSEEELEDAGFLGFNIVGCIQRLMARLLSQDFQLDCLDYQAENWYHADLDFETFKLLEHEKGESCFTLARDMALKSTKAIVQPSPIPENLGPWRSKLLWASRVLPMPLVGLVMIGSVCTESTDVQNQASEFPELEAEFPILEALYRLDFGAAMKLYLAKMLTSEFIQTGDVDEGSVIVGERNKAATEALQIAIDNGHNKIAILYGGGHMPDLGRRLREEFDLVPTRVQWITAWSIRNRDLTTSSLPFLKTMAEVLGWPLNRNETLKLLFFLSVLGLLALDLWFWKLFFGTTVNWVFRITSFILHFVHSAKVV